MVRRFLVYFNDLIWFSFWISHPVFEWWRPAVCRIICYQAIYLITVIDSSNFYRWINVTLIIVFLSKLKINQLPFSLYLFMCYYTNKYTIYSIHFTLLDIAFTDTNPSNVYTHLFSQISSYRSQPIIAYSEPNLCPCYCKAWTTVNIKIYQLLMVKVHTTLWSKHILDFI